MFLPYPMLEGPNIALLWHLEFEYWNRIPAEKNIFSIMKFWQEKFIYSCTLKSVIEGVCRVLRGTWYGVGGLYLALDSKENRYIIQNTLYWSFPRYSLLAALIGSSLTSISSSLSTKKSSSSIPSAFPPRSFFLPSLILQNTRNFKNSNVLK